MKQFLVRASLPAFAVLVALPVSAQPPGNQRPPDPVSPHTAFPELTTVDYEDKTVPLPGGGTQTRQVPRNPIVVPTLPAPTADELLLRKVRRAQARAGLSYLALVTEGLQIVGPDPNEYDNDLRMAIETYRAAAELEDQPIRRVPWYSARIRVLKESEGYTLRRVKAGALQPELFHRVCFERLRAEADLLVLKAAITTSEAGTRQLPEPPRPAVLDNEPLAPPMRTQGQRIEPAFTAFPDLKPPTVRYEQTPTGTKEIEEGRVPLPNLVAVGPDAAPLLRTRRAQVNAGMTYLVRVEAARKLFGPNPNDYQNDLAFAARAFVAAAELEPHLRDRVPWYEARVRTFKEVEAYVERRVEAGALNPKRLHGTRFQRLAAEIDLLALLGALATAGTGTPVPAVGRAPFASDKVKPQPEPNAFTAFPDLKPLPAPPTGPSGQKRIDELLTSTKPLVPASNETPLQRVRREQVLCGTAFLTQLERAREHFGPNPANFLLEQAFVATVCRSAAEREPNRANRIAWHEVCIRLLKESEQYTEQRVSAGTLPPQRLDQAQFDRLGAEIDLLLLKAEAAPPAAIPATGPTTLAVLVPCSPQCYCEPVCSPKVRTRCGLLPRFFHRR